MQRQRCIKFLLCVATRDSHISEVWLVANTGLVYMRAFEFPTFRSGTISKWPPRRRGFLSGIQACLGRFGLRPLRSHGFYVLLIDARLNLAPLTKISHATNLKKNYIEVCKSFIHIYGLILVDNYFIHNFIIYDINLSMS